jgi:flagellar L-ring protein precursor FlgH
MRYLLSASLRTLPSALWLFATGCWFIAALVCLFCAVTARGDSLWTTPNSDQRSMCADRKAARVGDIITIVVSETAAQVSSQSKTTNSTSAVDSSVSQFLYPSTVSKFGTSGGALPAIKFGGKNDYTGGGAVNNSQSLTARAAVLVTEVLPNGNLVIEGVRRVTFSGETQHLVLHGVVRPDDIAPDNTVISSSVADARLEFLSEGDLTSASKKGWLSKLYESLRPF